MADQKLSKYSNNKRSDPVLKGCAVIQGTINLNKLKRQCHYDQRMKKLKIKRDVLISRELDDAIDVKLLRPELVDEIGMELEKIEKDKKVWKQKQIESDLTIVSKLLEEQGKKQKDKAKVKTKWEDLNQNGNYPQEEILSKEESVEFHYEEEEEGEMDLKDEENVDVDKIDSPMELDEKEAKHEVSQEEVKETIHPGQRILGEDPTKVLLADLDEAKVLIQKKKKEKISVLMGKEKSVVADPTNVNFSNFEKDKIYTQELKLKNIGTDLIHCRYLKTEFEDENNDDPNPIMVIISSCLLHPGLSVKVKITLHTTSSNDMNGKLIFETKRKKLQQEKRHFFVPISCTLPTAIITVTPVKINFPAVPWCCATGPRKSQILKKVLKIKNSGGKTCVVKISGESLLENKSYSEEDIEGEFEIYGSAVAAEIMDELISNVFETFRFSQRYHVEVEPFSTKNIEVTFSPKYKGFHCEIYTFKFENCKDYTEQKLELTGDIEKMAIRAEPSVIDFKTCVMDSGVYQGTFTVFNDSHKTFPVAAKIPHCLKNHCKVFPSEPVIRGSRFCNFSIKFYPRCTLPEDARQYYCTETQLLEFPIFIRQCTSHSCKPDYLKIYAFALITDYALEVTPANISFGTVSTLETVRKEIYLTNHSLAVQEYGFLNLPKGVRIEPNLGFGRIFPKETILLYVLFSPLVENIDKDNLGPPGNRNRFFFNIRAFSLAEFGGFGKKSEKDVSSEAESIWPEELLGEETINDIFSSSEESKPSDKNKNEVVENIEEIPEPENFPLKIQEKEQMIREFLEIDDISEFSFFHRVMKKSNQSLRSENKNEDLGEVERFSTVSLDYRKNKNVIACESYVLDPYCELSSSIIRLPATPCSSFSLTKFYLNGTNSSTASRCYCGLKNKLQGKNTLDLKFQFEFQYDCPDIKIEPLSGYLEYGKKVAITIVFRPEFPVHLLRQETKMQKSIKIFDEVNKEKETPQPSSTKLPKGKKDKKQKSMLELPKYENPVEIMNSPLCVLLKNDFFAGEKILQRTMSPFCKETKVLCVVKSEKYGLVESHEMIIITPTVKPDFIFLGDSQEISFGKVPTGITSKFVVRIQNIVMERIRPRLSLLNPFGPFSCPVGSVELDPELIWNIPITFTPLEEKGITSEFFEITSGKTIFSLKVSGEGIDPKYSFNPEFAVTRIESKPKGFSEFKLDFQNLCEANLTLNFVKGFTKERISPPPPEDKQTKKKLSKIQTEITEEIISQLENDYRDLEEGDDSIFTILGFENELIVPSFATINIKIRFQPPGEGDKNYVSKYKITLGKNKVLKEFLIFGTVTKGK